MRSPEEVCDSAMHKTGGVTYFRNFVTMRVQGLYQNEYHNEVFGVGVSCRNLYYFVVYLYVNGSGSITLVGEEKANLSAVVYL